MLKSFLDVADHDDSSFLDLEIARVARELNEARPAGEIEIENQRSRSRHVLHGRGTIKLPGPFDESRIEPRLHVERTLRIPHPLERQSNRAWRRERHEVTRRNHPCVSVRAAKLRLGSTIDNSDAMPTLRRVVRGAESDDAAADDQNVLRH